MAQDPKTVNPPQGQTSNPAGGVASKLNQQVAGKGGQPSKQASVDRIIADRELLDIIRNVSEMV
jgi:hypothetical protein